MTWYLAQIQAEETKMQSQIVYGSLSSQLGGIQLVEYNSFDFEGHGGREGIVH